jgi:hypothetical protein
MRVGELAEKAGKQAGKLENEQVRQDNEQEKLRESTRGSRS